MQPGLPRTLGFRDACGLFSSHLGKALDSLDLGFPAGLTVLLTGIPQLLLLVNSAQQHLSSNTPPEGKLCNCFSKTQISVLLVACSVLVTGTLLSFTSLLNDVSMGYVQ